MCESIKALDGQKKRNPTMGIPHKKKNTLWQVKYQMKSESDNRPNSSAPWQPEKDLTWHPTAADWHSNIGANV